MDIPSTGRIRANEGQPHRGRSAQADGSRCIAPADPLSFPGYHGILVSNAGPAAASVTLTVHGSPPATLDAVTGLWSFDFDTDPIDAPVPIVSLVERFGRERAMADTLACIDEIVAAHLNSLQ